MDILKKTKGKKKVGLTLKYIQKLDTLFRIGIEDRIISDFKSGSFCALKLCGLVSVPVVHLGI